MRLPRTIILFFILCFALSTNAQDRHFTLYNFSPLVINPAYAGSFEGSVRAGGLLREQSFGNNISTIGRVYSTQNGFVDAPLLNVGKRKDWVGVGVNIYTDKAGTFGLGYQTFHGSIAYHLALDKRRNSVLTLGIQGGNISRRIGRIRGNADPYQQAIYPDAQFDTQSPFALPNPGGGGGTGGNQNQNEPSASFFDLGAGMLLKSKLNKATKIEIGFSLQHITRNFRFPMNGNEQRSNYALQGLTDNDDFRIPTLFLLHGTYDVALTDIWSVSPSFLFQQSGNQNEAVIQFLGGYKLLRREIRDDGKKGKLIKDDEAPKIRFGLGYRIGDALQVLLGYEKGPLKVGIGYDLTLSTLADANNRNGAIEIAANYIFSIYKQPDVDPAILCPKF